MKLKKNLLLLGTTSYGEELSISDQNKFNELNSEFNIFVFTLGTSSKTKKFSNVTIEYTKKPKFIYFQYLKFYFLNYFKLKKFIHKNDINIVSSRDPITALLPVLIRKFSSLDYKIILENHGDFKAQLLQQRNNFILKKLSFLIDILTKFILKNIDILRGVNIQNTNKFLIDNISVKFYNFPAWVDNIIFNNKKFQKRTNLLFVGNVIERKGVYFLIKSLKQFLLDNKDIHFYIVGAHPDKNYFHKCVQYIEENNLIKSVSFFPKKSSEEISKLMNEAKILLMASTSEGLPRVLIESGLCGLPALASKIDGIEQPFSTEGGTSIYNLLNNDEFEKLINKLYFDEKFWNKQSIESEKLSLRLSGHRNFANNWKKLVELIDE
jgi:glycosyltransferase involved in cell wall biosynthesis